jgi:protein SCO1/2
MTGLPADQAMWSGADATRRRLISAAGAFIGALALDACARAAHWSAGDDVTGVFPPLAFTLTRAKDGRVVTEVDYRGRVPLLYFGYTFCPDVCPTTLLNVAQVLKRLGPSANQVRVLFVTVDPNRDTLPILKDYSADFSPQVDGLRPTPDQLAGLARRYRAAYSVSPGDKDHPYTATHSSAIYVFDKRGNARVLLTSLSTGMPNIDGAAADLRQLIA